MPLGVEAGQLVGGRARLGSQMRATSAPTTATTAPTSTVLLMASTNAAGGVVHQRLARRAELGGDVHRTTE